MVIRRATPTDTAEIIALSLHFTQATAYGALFQATPAGVALLTARIFALEPEAAIFLALDGAEATPFGLIVLVAARLTGTEDAYADEIVWWVEPSHRGLRAGPALLDAAEAWARTRGLRLIKMVAPIPSGVGRFYERRGYQAIETAYAKQLEAAAWS